MSGAAFKSSERIKRLENGSAVEENVSFNSRKGNLFRALIHFLLRQVFRYASQADTATEENEEKQLGRMEEKNREIMPENCGRKSLSPCPVLRGLLYQVKR